MVDISQAPLFRKFARRPNMLPAKSSLPPRRIPHPAFADFSLSGIICVSLAVRGHELHQSGVLVEFRVRPGRPAGKSGGTARAGIVLDVAVSRHTEGDGVAPYGITGRERKRENIARKVQPTAPGQRSGIKETGTGNDKQFCTPADDISGL